MLNLIAMVKKWLETSTARQKLTVALMAFGLLSTGALLLISGSSQTASDPLGSNTFYFVSAFVKLLLVLLLIVACSVIFRRWLQHGPTGKSIRQLRVIETVRLSPKQAIHLVVIGNQQLLIGATDQNVSLIAPVETSLDVTPVEEAQPQPGLDFSSLLQSFTSHQPTDASKGKV